MSGVILKVNKDKTVPDELVDKLLAKFTQTIGVAVVEGGELKVLQSDEGADKDTFKLVLKDYLDAELFIYLGDTKPTALDMQPFLLLKGPEEKPILTAFLAGNFDKHKAGGNNSAEWFAVEGDLLSRMRDTFDLCGSDVSKLMERLQTNTLLERDIRRLYDDWGTITFIANTGEHHTIETGTKTLDADWGWVTDPLDYSSGVHATEASPKKFSLQNFRRGIAQAISPDKPAAVPPVATPSAPPAAKPAGPTPAAPTPAVAPKAAAAPPKAAAAPAAVPTARPPTPAATPPVAPKATPAAPPKVVEQNGEVLIPKVELTDEEKFYEPPADITNNKALQACYRREAGFLPDNWKMRPKVEISNRKQKVKLREKGAKVVKSFQEMGQVLNGGTVQTATSVPTLPPKAAIPPVAKQPQPVTGKEKEYPETGTKHIPEEVEVGILSAAQKKALNEFISDGKTIKMIDKHSKVVVNPADLQAFEEKRPSFTDVTGLELDDMINWPPQVFIQMAKHDPAWAERLITQAVYERHCMKQLLNRKGISEEETPAAKPAVPAAPTPPAPPKPPVAAPPVAPRPPVARRQVA